MEEIESEKAKRRVGIIYGLFPGICPFTALDFTFYLAYLFPQLMFAMAGVLEICSWQVRVGWDFICLIKI